jgi:SPP1 family predicted phage head-tail adaptor
MLSDAELADMRATTDDPLPDTCTIQSKSRTTTASGNTYTYATVATVACKWVPLTAREQLLAHQMGKVIDGKVRFAYGQAIPAEHRLVIGGLGYEVIGFSVDHAWRLQTIADVIRVSMT